MFHPPPPFPPLLLPPARKLRFRHPSPSFRPVMIAAAALLKRARSGVCRRSSARNLLFLTRILEFYPMLESFANNLEPLFTLKMFYLRYTGQ